MNARHSTRFELSNVLRLGQPRSAAAEKDLGNTPCGCGPGPPTLHIFLDTAQEIPKLTHPGPTSDWLELIQAEVSPDAGVVNARYVKPYPCRRLSTQRHSAAEPQSDTPEVKAAE